MQPLLMNYLPRHFFRHTLVLSLLLAACSCRRLLDRPPVMPHSPHVETDRPGAAPTFPQTLLDETRARFPRQPLRIDGHLLVKSLDGKILRRFPCEILFHYQEGKMSGTYTIEYASGDKEELTISRKGFQTVRLEYRTGTPPAQAQPPVLTETIDGSNLTWEDLTLGFLWWDALECVQTQKIRGRYCYVVRMRKPPRTDGMVTQPSYEEALLWIDHKLHVLLKAEAYDANRKLIRRLEVESFKKIDGQWMPKDLLFHSYPSDHRTKLRIDSVTVVETDNDNSSG